MAIGFGPAGLVVLGQRLHRCAEVLGILRILEPVLQGFLDDVPDLATTLDRPHANGLIEPIIRERDGDLHRNTLPSRCLDLQMAYL